MRDRPYLRELLRWGVGIAAAFLLARYGIQVPPPPAVPDTPAPPTMPDPPRSTPDVKAAISRIQFGNSGCTATPIGQPRPDGRIWVLTASHCVREIGQRGKLTTQRGDQLTVTVVAIDSRADCAWLLTDSTSIHIPYAEIADTVPEPGQKIWHAGYGVHIPGNREEGEFVGGPDGNGQLRFKLSVSSGDSGGAIVIDSQGRVVSCVCCTSGRGQLADVWGSGPAAIKALRQGAVDQTEWTPIELPERKPTGGIPKESP